MGVRLYWPARMQFGFLCVALIIIGCAGFTDLGYADSEPNERAKKELQRATKIARLLDVGPVVDPHCPFPDTCGLHISNVGRLGFALRDMGIFNASSAPHVLGPEEVVTCTWLVAFLTGVEDLSVAEAIAQELVTDARVTKQTVSTTVLGANFTAAWRQAGYVACKGNRL